MTSLHAAPNGVHGHVTWPRRNAFLDGRAKSRELFDRRQRLPQAQLVVCHCRPKFNINDGRCVHCAVIPQLPSRIKHAGDNTQATAGPLFSGTFPASAERGLRTHASGPQPSNGPFVHHAPYRPNICQLRRDRCGSARVCFGIPGNLRIRQFALATGGYRLETSRNAAGKARSIQPKALHRC